MPGKKEIKFVTIRMECWHTKTLPEKAAENIIINDYTFCFKCGKKRRVTWKGP